MEPEEVPQTMLESHNRVVFLVGTPYALSADGILTQD